MILTWYFAFKREVIQTILAIVHKCLDQIKQTLLIGAAPRH